MPRTDKPLLFISHKHADKEIATAVAKFIRDRTLGSVDVFLSSNWEFQGPRFGSDVNKELIKKLLAADALILIYTSAIDQDWSYCMWECGVATDPNGDETRLIVFQCGREVPSPFVADLRVDVRDSNALIQFTKQFLSDPNFFPARAKPVAPDIAEETIKKAAEELYENIKKEIPPGSDLEMDEWTAWPYLRLELPQAEVETLKGAKGPDRLKLAHEIIRERGIIVKSDTRAPQLFGLAGITDNYPFKELLRVWKENFPALDAAWFDSCCEQIMVGARRGFPLIRWAPIKGIDGEANYVPVLSRVKRLPFKKNTVQFDLYLYNLSDPKAIPAYSRMLPKDQFFYKKIDQPMPKDIKLVELIIDLKQRGLNRIPFFNSEDHPLYIVHRSMIDRFVVEKMVSGDGNRSDLTLADLLQDEEMMRTFNNSFVVVNKLASLDEAKSAMVTRPGCSDIFITEQGSRNEPVLGWLTNVDISRDN